MKRSIDFRFVRAAAGFSSALAVVLGFPLVSLAQEEPDAAETAAARALAVEGVKLAQADRCAEALESLDRAEKLRHSAIVLAHLGQCQVKLGKWVEGSESLRKTLREPLPENPSPALEQAYQSAMTTLRDLKPRIPQMKIIVNAPREVELKLTIDGETVQSSVIGVALPANPGDHLIEVTAPGFLRSSKQLTLAPGASTEVELVLERDPSAPVAAPHDEQAQSGAVPHEASFAADSEPTAAETSSSGAGKVLAYLSYGVGAVGLGVGIGFGQAAMSEESKLRAACPNRICPPERKAELDRARSKGTISTIGFAAAGGGLALGTILLLTSGSSSESQQRGTTQTRARTASGVKPRAALGVGLGSVSVNGEF